MPQSNKRRNPNRRKGDESESDGSGAEERSDGVEEPSLSPEIPAAPLARRPSNADKRPLIDAYPSILPPSSSSAPELARPHDGHELHSINHVGGHGHTHSLHGYPREPARPATSGGLLERHDGLGRSLFRDNELPHIATLMPDGVPSMMSAATLPPIRPASEQQAAQRKRANTLPGRGSRPSAGTGPKVVACNFCRARKTKCDGGHPACSSCARRSLPCNYNHESQNGQRKGGRRGSTSKVPNGGLPAPLPIGATNEAHLPPGPSSSGLHSPSRSPVAERRYADTSRSGSSGSSAGEGTDVDLKRKFDDDDRAQVPKRLRVDDREPAAIVF